MKVYGLLFGPGGTQSLGALLVGMYAGVTMLLTVSVLQLVVNETLPTTSDAVPFIGKSHQFNRTLKFRLHLVCLSVRPVLHLENSRPTAI